MSFLTYFVHGKPVNFYDERKYGWRHQIWLQKAAAGRTVQLASSVRGVGVNLKKYENLKNTLSIVVEIT